MIIKWTKKLKNRFGWFSAKDLYIPEKKYLKRKCFHLHDWHHDGHLVCVTNANHGYPEGWEEL